MPRAGVVRRRVRLRRSGRPTGVVLRRFRGRGDPRTGDATRAHPRAAGGHRPQSRRARCDGRRQLGPGGQGGPWAGRGPARTHGGRIPRPGATSPTRRRCSRATTSSGHLASIRPVTGWPWWCGTTRTCRGTPRRCSWCHSSRSEGDGMLQVAGPPWPVAGGPGESVGQPAWCRDGTLRFVSDRRGWWQPYVHPGVPEAGSTRHALTDVAAEFHGPDWVLGQCTMAELADGTLVARQTASGRDSLVPLGLRRPGRSAGPAVRLDRRALCPRWGAGTDRQHTRGAGERLGVGAGKGRPRPALRGRARRSPAGTLRGGSPSRSRDAPVVPSTARSTGRRPRPRLRPRARRRWSRGATVAPRPRVRRGWTSPCSSSRPAVSPWPAWTMPGARGTGGRTGARSGGNGVSPMPRTASMPRCTSPRAVTSTQGGWRYVVAVREA